MARYREKLRDAARAITRDDSRARELADSLYADLFGTRTRDGCRISKLSHYSGRGALAGWLRTVLARLRGRGLIHAVEEFREPHFHVMVGRAYDEYARALRSPILAGGC